MFYCTPTREQNTGPRWMQSFYSLLGKYLEENGPSLPACTFTDRESPVFKATVLNWRMITFLGQCGTKTSCHPFCGLPASDPWLEWWKANTAYLFIGEEGRWACYVVFSLFQNRSQLLLQTVLEFAYEFCCFGPCTKPRGDAVKTPSTGLSSARTFSESAGLPETQTC